MWVGLLGSVEGCFVLDGRGVVEGDRGGEAERGVAVV